MSVSIINLIDGVQAGAALGSFASSAPPYQATFRFLTGDGSSFSLVLPYNPDGWSTEQAAQWEPRRALGVAEDASDWRGNPPGEVSFDWLATSDDPERLELGTLRPLELYVSALDRLTGEPYLVVLQLGAHEYRGQLTRVQVERLQTDARGWALVARVNISLQRNPKRPGARR